MLTLENKKRTFLHLNYGSSCVLFSVGQDNIDYERKECLHLYCINSHFYDKIILFFDSGNEINEAFFSKWFMLDFIHLVKQFYAGMTEVAKTFYVRGHFMLSDLRDRYIVVKLETLYFDYIWTCMKWKSFFWSNYYYYFLISASRYPRDPGCIRQARPGHRQAKCRRDCKKVWIWRWLLCRGLVLVAKDKTKNMVYVWRALFIVNR